ncbi:Rv3235 family protein [Paractinoplanes rishiriensis]|uniref:Uncharacterized protein n=1 Tax=Paractinoplanes rishiriensis TaxID=1050105 RepID=A0A919MUJ0_9ACTN|nr:Rv3235 family protein [Actinoplanes rishiriensis]GIE95843.1 hypothetical protein Ari01nite_33080 [Actinoplanes rishiriensis]
MRRTVEVATSGPRPSISLRPVPPCEPPFDDELEPVVWATAHQLALEWAPARQRPPHAAPPPRPPLPRSVVAGASHEAKLAVHRFVRLCVEVLNGHRPPAHLRQLSRPAEAGSVIAQALSGARRVADLRRTTPARRPPRRPAPVAVVRLRLCEPRPGAVEAAVALVTGERTWAMALRLERHDESWAATALRLI